MRIFPFLKYIGILAITTPSLAADYRQSSQVALYPPIGYVGIPTPKPIYLVASPPQYVQDLRTGRPGYWITPQPSFFDRLFGERNGY